MTIVQGFGFIVDEGYAEIDFTPATIEVIEAEPMPELPAECWHRTEASGDERMRAVRALARGQ